jgi:hypothetical protein
MHKDTPVYTERTEPGPRARADHAHIPGWGADLDPAVRPAVPKERTPPRLDAPAWDAPPPQAQHVEVLRSTERPGITPIFGSTVPPSGVSGLLRRGAYRFSENDIRRWLTLLVADRVNVVEGLVEDLAHGQVPNVFAEMGGPAEWRHNRAGFMRKAMVTGAVAGVAWYLLTRRRR